MPASRCVAQDCNNGSNQREGISLHNSPPSGSVLSSWKRFVSSHRKNFSLGENIDLTEDKYDINMNQIQHLAYLSAFD